MLVENLLSVTSYAPDPAIRPPWTAAAVTVLWGQTSPVPRHMPALIIGRRRWACGLPRARFPTTGVAGMSTREDWSSGMVSTTVGTPLLRLLSTALLLSDVQAGDGRPHARVSIKVLINPKGAS